MTSGTAQRQQQCLRQRHRADHVDVELRSPIVDTRRGEAIGKRHSGDVHEHVAVP